MKKKKSHTLLLRKESVNVDGASFISERRPFGMLSLWKRLLLANKETIYICRMYNYSGNSSYPDSSKTSTEGVGRLSSTSVHIRALLFTIARKLERYNAID